MIDLTVLRTARLALRPFTLDDAPFIVELLSTEGWLRFIGDRGVRSVEDAQRYLRDGPIAMQAARGHSLWAVQRRADGVLLGMCGLIKRDALPDVDIGWALLPEHEGCGYAREAARAVLDFGFERLGLPRVVAIMDGDNARSARLAEALGMRFEGEKQLAGWDEPSAIYAITRP
jgi:RimJ/RimL family protein N-acetyltransferase